MKHTGIDAFNINLRSWKEEHIRIQTTHSQRSTLIGQGERGSFNSALCCSFSAIRVLIIVFLSPKAYPFGFLLKGNLFLTVCFRHAGRGEVARSADHSGKRSCKTCL